MPRKHISTSTPELNAALRRIRSHIRNGPQSVALCALIVSSLVQRWRRSNNSRDKRLLRIVESLGEIEDQVEGCGGNVGQELERPGHGLFRPLLDDLVFRSLDSKLPLHDPLVLRFQYDSLWSFIEHHHPLPAASALKNADMRKKETAKRVGEWLKTYWKACGEVMLEYPCYCQYRTTEPTYSALYYGERDYTTKQDLFDRLLAYLHDSNPSAIEQDLKPSRRKALDRRM